MDIIVSCGNSTNLYYWRTNPFEYMGEMHDLHDDPIRVIIPYKYNSFVTGGHDSKIKLWKCGNPNPVKTFSGHRNRIQALYILDEFHKSRYVVSGSRDDEIRVWHLDKGTCHNVISTNHGGITSIVELSSNTVASVGKDLQLNVWDLNGGSIPRINTVRCSVNRPQYGSWYITSLDVDLRSNLLFSTSDELILWDMMSMKVVFSKSNVGKLTYVKYFDDKRSIVIGDVDGSLRCLDVRKISDSNKMIESLWTSKVHHHWINQVIRMDSIPSTKNIIASCGDDGLIFLTDIDSGNVVDGLDSNRKNGSNCSRSMNMGYCYGISAQRIFSFENLKISTRDKVERRSFLVRDVTRNFEIKINQTKILMVFRVFVFSCN